MYKKIWMILFDQGSIYGKRRFKVQNCLLVAELKLKRSLFADLTYSALSYWGTFHFEFTFPIYGLLVKKVSLRFSIIPELMKISWAIQKGYCFCKVPLSLVFCPCHFGVQIYSCFMHIPKKRTDEILVAVTLLFH